MKRNRSAVIIFALFGFIMVNAVNILPIEPKKIANNILPIEPNKAHILPIEPFEIANA